MKNTTLASLVLVALGGFVAGCDGNTTAAIPNLDLSWADTGGNNTNHDGQTLRDLPPGPDQHSTDSGPADTGPADGDPADATVVDGAADGGNDGAADGANDGAADSAADAGGDVTTADLAAADSSADVGPDAGVLTVTTTGHFYEHLGPGALDVTTLVSGGMEPLVCSFYVGAGMGTGPLLGITQLAGCSLSSSFKADDLPGVYGFIVIVKDQLGQQVEIPIVIRNGSCNTATGSVTPTEYPVQVLSPPGGALDYALQLLDVDAVCEDAGCTTCPACVVSAAGTKAPLALTAGLNCANPGDVCLDVGTINGTQSCPGVVSWTSAMHVKSHTPVRADGKPGWITLHSDIDYSGTITSPGCGNKNWSCHWEVMELPQ